MSDVELDRALAILGNSGRLGSDKEDVEIIPTKWTDLNDWLLQCGGFARGRAYELFAATSVGKSTFAQWIAGQVQEQFFKLGFGDGSTIERQGTVCWFDAEGTLMTDYATSSGMQMDRTVLPSFGLGNDFRHKLKQAIASDAFDLIVVDSIQGVIPDDVANVDGARNMRDKLSSSIYWNQTFQELVGGFQVTDAKARTILSKHPEHIYGDSGDDEQSGKSKKEREIDTFHKLEHKKCVVIFINHERTEIKTGGFGRAGKYTPGGKTKDFLFSGRISMRQISAKTGKVKGNRTLKFKQIELKITKNKLGIPARTLECNLGIDGTLMLDESELTDIKIDISDETEEERTEIESLKERLAARREAKETEADELEDDDGEDS